jgi:hypothetical protein
MNIRRIAGFVFVGLTAGIFVFQIALAFGAPWGSYAMGGEFPGQFPPELRVAAVVQALLWVFFSCVVLSRAGIALPRWARASRWLVWIVVALAGISLVLNIMTPSTVERMIWAPVAFVMLICSLLVATGPTLPNQ